MRASFMKTSQNCLPDKPPASIRRWASDVAVSGYTALVTGLISWTTLGSVGAAMNL